MSGLVVARVETALSLSFHILFAVFGVGLPWLILDGRFSERTKALVVAGPVGVRDRVERTFECLYPGAGDAERGFETRFLEFAEGSPTELGPAVITPFEC